ncbi:LysR family transcriptional regulator [Paenibacillus flagellatus]|uniref:LysR family transcriptional regulator n=1 Tax=Paenibacillus flagellatus TaxID=2211139 RepID=A0A2V5KF19_9BACL|nr:LysR family transcriptional regulator [Paenibacillus flagellatus]PYI52660.1 LysR family transcriptional regulator [Paenibacillus flagellatus]
MNLHAFRLFHETVECGGVTKASERLRISQPAVTAQLRNLERELGLTLFRAKGRGLALTEAGERLAAEARRLFALERDIEREAERIRLGETGTLRIAATYVPAHMLLPAWIAPFKRAHPDVNIVLTTVNSLAAFDLLLHYEADLAVAGGGRELPAGLAYEPLLRDELRFIVPAGHPLADRTVTLARLFAEPFVVREQGSSGRETLTALCRMYGVAAPAVGLTCSGTGETIRAVAAGYGAALVSALEVRDSVRRGEVAVVEAEGVRLPNPIGLYRRQDDPLPPTADRFARWIAETRGSPTAAGERAEGD